MRPASVVALGFLETVRTSVLARLSTRLGAREYLIQPIRGTFRRALRET